MKAAIFDCTPEFLAAVLRLPEGAYVDQVIAPHDRPGVLRIRCVGVGYEVTPGMTIPTIRPWFKETNEVPGVIATWEVK